MRYKDRIYGKFEIKEPIILEIIDSPSLQRLKHIDQAGHRAFWIKPDVNTDEYSHSRFAHSLGVYLLLNKHNAPLEEQIAGLIHDVSHSAFSHCIDYVLDSGSEKKQCHQDDCFDDFVKKTEIPEIIKKYSLDLEYILNDKNFPLEENELPNLCADRIDYSLRTAVIFGEIDDEDKSYFLNNIAVENNKWIFKNFKCAKRYAKLFRTLNTIYYSSFSSAVMFKSVSNCLRYALQRKYISEDDLYTTDEAVIGKIKENLNDKRLKLLWKQMNDKSLAYNNPEDYNARIFCKSRIVDPLFKDNDGTIKRLSEIETNWAHVVKKELQPKEYFVNFNHAR